MQRCSSSNCMNEHNEGRLCSEFISEAFWSGSLFATIVISRCTMILVENTLQITSKKRKRKQQAKLAA